MRLLLAWPVHGGRRRAGAARDKRGLVEQTMELREVAGSIADQRHQFVRNPTGVHEHVRTWHLKVARQYLIGRALAGAELREPVFGDTEHNARGEPMLAGLFAFATAHGEHDGEGLVLEYHSQEIGVLVGRALHLEFAAPNAGVWVKRIAGLRRQMAHAPKDHGGGVRHLLLLANHLR
jgi:hypothetical protein